MAERFQALPPVYSDKEMGCKMAHPKKTPNAELTEFILQASIKHYTALLETDLKEDDRETILSLLEIEKTKQKIKCCDTSEY